MNETKRKPGQKLTPKERQWLLANADSLGVNECARQLGVGPSAVSQWLKSRAVLIAEVTAEKEREAVRHWLDEKEAAATVHALLAEAMLRNIAHKKPDGAADFGRYTVNGGSLPLVREIRAEMRELSDLRGWVVKQSRIRVDELSNEKILELLDELEAEGDSAEGSGAAGTDPETA